MSHQTVTPPPAYEEFAERVRTRAIVTAAKYLEPRRIAPGASQNALGGLATVVASSVAWAQGDLVGSAAVQVEEFGTLWELHFYYEANPDPALRGWERHTSYNISLGDHVMSDAPESVWETARRALP
jgi:hypothetical protein